MGVGGPVILRMLEFRPAIFLRENRLPNMDFPNPPGKLFKERKKKKALFLFFEDLVKHSDMR